MHTIKPFNSIQFAYDDLSVPSDKRRLHVLINGKQFPRIVNVDDNEFKTAVKINKNHSGYLTVNNLGASIVVNISQKPLKNISKQETNNYNININLPLLGISFIDKTPMELMYAWMSDLKINIDIFQII